LGWCFFVAKFLAADPGRTALNREWKQTGMECRGSMPAWPKVGANL